jgi:DNA-directed RNA polymerase omega subunit
MKGKFMAKVFVQDALKHCEDDQYELIAMAAKRAREISKGSAPKVDSDSSASTVLALEEIAKGLYTKEQYIGSIKPGEELTEENNTEVPSSEHQPTQGE